MAQAQAGIRREGRPLTGRKVFLFLVAAFGLIITVNVVMAYKAISTFPGLDVENSYVASQTFDADRKAQLALGWHLTEDYRPGAYRLIFTDTAGNPARVRDVSATIGRATEAKDDVTPVFSYDGKAFTAPLTLQKGKWMILLVAHADDGTLYQKRLNLQVTGDE